MDLSDRSMVQLQEAAKHVRKMQGIVEQDERKLGGDFSLVRGLLATAQREIEAETARKAKGTSDIRAEISFVPAPEENAISNPTTQAAITAASGALRDEGLQVSSRHMTFDAVGGGGGLTGDFSLPLIQAVLGSTVIGTVIVAWLQGRAGRKTRLKIGNIEVEARTPDEIVTLLKTVKDFQATAQQPDDDKKYSV